MRGLLAAALVEAGLVTWRDLKVSKLPPPPSDYVAVAIVYGGLSLLPDSASSVASLFGWGLILATLMNFWDPATPTTLGPNQQRQQDINNAFAFGKPGSLANPNPPAQRAPLSGVPSSGGGFIVP